ncbi:hypothetical protein hrd7_08910 [Leptolinea sp. HRD-7]|nr:hypothetical protein hrd7_08910 [Leptolinea sp. HRD-7]
MKKTFVLIGRILALTIIGLIVTIIASAVTPQPEIVRAAQNSGNPNTLVLLLVERLVVALIFAFILENTVVRGWKLVGYMVWAVFGIATFMIQIETIVFGSAFPGLSVPDVLMLVLTAFVGTVIFVPMAILVMGKWKGTNPQTRPLFNKEYLPRVALIAVIYPVIYFFFGYFVAWQFEAVREFYATSTITTAQPLLTIIQIVRGALWVVSALPLLVMFEKRWQIITAIAVSFSLLPSIALILPNPVMPAPVAHAHLIEMVSSMLLFGLVTGWIMTGSKEKIGNPEDIR